MTGLEACTPASKATSEQREDLLKGPQKIAWWNWIHVFSLDAVAVAVVWHLLLSKAYQAQSGARTAILLGSSVWVIYLLDHWLDAGKSSGGLEPARKRFFLAHRTLIFWSITSTALLTVFCARWLLPERMFLAGTVFAGLVLLYFVLVHCLAIRYRVLWPREGVVAAVFSGGVAMPTWLNGSPDTFQFAAVVLPFFLFCWFNCCAVEVWEWQAAGGIPKAEPHSSARWIAHHFALLSVAAALLGWVVACLCSASYLVPTSLLISGLAFLAIAIWEGANKRRDRTPLACFLLDLALLSPMLIVLGT